MRKVSPAYRHCLGGNRVDEARREDRRFNGREYKRTADAKHGFVLLPRRWVVERSFAWATRFRRLAKDYERLPQTLAGLHFVVFAILMLAKAVKVLQSA